MSESRRSLAADPGPALVATRDLVRMVNQIAANFSYLSDDEAAAETASHLRSFWTPEMRQELCDDVPADELVAAARGARALLLQQA